MRKDLTIALAISLLLGAAAIWGSCAVPHPRGQLTESFRPPAEAGAGDPNLVAVLPGGPTYVLN